jgi:hypothetical protein
MIPQSLDSPFAKKPALYVVAAAIREAYETGGELSAAIELRRRVQDIVDNAVARQQATAIAAWTPLPDRPKPCRMPRKGRQNER